MGAAATATAFKAAEAPARAHLLLRADATCASCRRHVGGGQQEVNRDKIARGSHGEGGRACGGRRGGASDLAHDNASARVGQPSAPSDVSKGG